MYDKAKFSRGSSVSTHTHTKHSNVLPMEINMVPYLFEFPDSKGQQTLAEGPFSLPGQHVPLSHLQCRHASTPQKINHFAAFTLWYWRWCHWVYDDTQRVWWYVSLLLVSPLFAFDLILYKRHFISNRASQSMKGFYEALAVKVP